MWINCKERMPEDMEAVIALRLGHWPGRGNSGIADVYAVDGEWFNLPEGIAIVGWMPVPDTRHLPIAEHYPRSNVESTSGNLPGSIEPTFPQFLSAYLRGITQR